MEAHKIIGDLCDMQLELREKVGVAPTSFVSPEPDGLLEKLDAAQRTAAAQILRDLLGANVTEDPDPSTVSARLDNPAQAAPVLPALEVCPAQSDR